MQNPRFFVAAVLVAGAIGALAACEKFESQDDGDGDGDASIGPSSSSSGSASSSSGDSGGAGDDASSTSGSTSSSSGTPGPPLSAWEQEVLDGLNQVRANAQPTPAPPLPVLVWNYDVAAVLQTWAEACVFEQPPVSTSGKIGAGGPPQTAFDAVSRTTDSNFDYASNTCSTGSCNSHRAAISRNVTSVACKVHDCTGHPPPSGAGPWEMWGCVFAPANDPSSRPY